MLSAWHSAQPSVPALALIVQFICSPICSCCYCSVSLSACTWAAAILECWFINSQNRLGQSFAVLLLLFLFLQLKGRLNGGEIAMEEGRKQNECWGFDLPAKKGWDKEFECVRAAGVDLPTSVSRKGEVGLSCSARLKNEVKNKIQTPKSWLIKRIGKHRCPLFMIWKVSAPSWPQQNDPQRAPTPPTVWCRWSSVRTDDHQCCVAMRCS